MRITLCGRPLFQPSRENALLIFVRRSLGTKFIVFDNLYPNFGSPFVPGEVVSHDLVLIVYL
jgi:hypothetical protein